MGLIADRPYEDILGDGIERILAQGAKTLDDFVVGWQESLFWWVAVREPDMAHVERIF